MPDYLDRLDVIESRQARAELADWQAAWLLRLQSRTMHEWRMIDLEDTAADTGALLEAGLEPVIGWPKIGALLRRLAGYRMD